jgi:glycosyltransferase involved in cell wall biosynthesis
LQVIPELETGGAEQTTLDVATAVMAAGGKAIVATHGGRMTKTLIQSGGLVEILNVRSKNPLTILANAFALARLIRRQNVHVIHARSRAPAISAYLAARLAGIPFVATYHGVYNARSFLKRWYNSVMTRGALTIANSDYTRDRVIATHKLAPEKVISIPRGVDLGRFDPVRVSPERVATLRKAWGLKDDDARLSVLLAGRLTRWKGQKLLIEALAALKAGGQDQVVLIMAGDSQGRDTYKGELQSLAQALGLEDRVRLVGHCDDMPAAYLACDAAAAPSLEPEAFGRTAVEPQIMGRPVLAADHGAATETVLEGVTGFRLTPGDREAWADGLARLIALGPKGRAAMGAAGQERAVRLYSANAMTSATLGVYAQILGTQP